MEEAARVVGVAPVVFAAWLSELLYRKVISASQYSKWTHDAEPISEAVVRLYLTQHAASQETPAPLKTASGQERHRRAKG